jgi:hypothetical protein
MSQVIELKNGKCETLFNERDFACLIEQHMGRDAANHFRELMKELDIYREKDEDYE